VYFASVLKKLLYLQIRVDTRNGLEMYMQNCRSPEQAAVEAAINQATKRTSTCYG
jgi:hypothetical protein